MSASLHALVAGIGTVAEDDPALLAALSLARRLSATLHVAHAFDLPEPLIEAYARSGELDPQIPERFGARIRERLEAVVSTLGPDQPVLCHVRNGAPARVLAQLAAEVKPDLLLVGAYRRNRIARYLFGTTADAVVRTATVPVLVLRDAEPVPPQRVLLATDLSALSTVVHDRGLAVVDALAGSNTPEIRAVLVVAYDAALPPPLRPESLDDYMEAELKRFLSERPVRTPPAEGRIRVGDPARELVAEASEWPADVIVVGTHGRSGLPRLMLGSVAGAVLRDAPCSVIVIPAALARDEAWAAAQRDAPERAEDQQLRA